VLELHAGGFAYSALAPLDATHVGCLFERDGYAAIAFMPIDLAGWR
jgi:hypothetical protein